jgi:hypothetical protein
MSDRYGRVEQQRGLRGEWATRGVSASGVAFANQAQFGFRNNLRGATINSAS